MRRRRQFTNDLGPASIMRRDIGFLWRVHAMSYLMVRPVSVNVTPKHGLSLIEWRIVITLARVSGITAQGIVELWGLEKMAVSRAVRRMLGANLIKRTRDAKDTRRQLLALTKKGENVYAAAWPNAELHYRQVTDVLSAGELKQFEAIADKLILRAQQIVQEVLSKE